MINVSKHSEVACLSKASIFKNLPLSLKKKLVTITSHQDFFPKGSLIRQPLDGQDGMIVIDSGHAKVYSLTKMVKKRFSVFSQRVIPLGKKIYLAKRITKTSSKLQRIV